MTARDTVKLKLEGLKQQFPVLSEAVIAEIMLAGASLLLEQPSQQFLLDLRLIAKGGSLEGPDVQSSL